MDEQNARYLEARRLRVEQGLAGTEIAQILNVSQTTIYKWLRGVSLTAEQHNLLMQQRKDAALKVIQKTALREQARQLRSELGLSIGNCSSY